MARRTARGRWMIAGLVVLAGCSGDDGPDPAATPTAPVTAPAAVTTVAAVADLVLLADGLGAVSFQTPYDAALTALSGELGPPDDPGTEAPDPVHGARRSVTWAHLRVDFTGPAGDLSFTGYLLSREPALDADGGFALGPWTPEAWESALATASGIGLGATASQAAAAYPQVYAARCDGTVAPGTFDAADTIDQLFVTAEQTGLYLYRPIESTVWAIGAQTAPDPMLCGGVTG